jgi:hypothetical protein
MSMIKTKILNRYVYIVIDGLEKTLSDYLQLITLNESFKCDIEEELQKLNDLEGHLPIEVIYLEFD